MLDNARDWTGIIHESWGFAGIGRFRVSRKDPLAQLPSGAASNYRFPFLLGGVHSPFRRSRDTENWRGAGFWAGQRMCFLDSGESLPRRAAGGVAGFV